MYRDEKFVVTKGRKGKRYGLFCFGDMAWLFVVFFLLFAMFVHKDSVTALN